MENNPVVINKVNSIAATFGWTVQSIQVTDSAVAYSTGAVTWATEFGVFTNNNVSVERTTYASITYQRDREDPLYSQWLVLENEYNDMLGRSFLDDKDHRRLEKIRQEATAKSEKIPKTIKKVVALCFLGMAAISLITFVIGFGQKLVADSGFFALIFFISGILELYWSNLITESDKKMNKSLANRSIKKNNEYSRLMELDAARREQARTEILDLARML